MPGVLGIQERKPAIRIGSLLRDLPIDRLGEMFRQFHHGGDAVIKPIQQKEESARKDKAHAQPQKQGAGKPRFDGDRHCGLLENIHVKLADILADIHVLHRPEKGIVELFLAVSFSFHFLEFRHFSPDLQSLGF